MSLLTTILDIIFWNFFNILAKFPFTTSMVVLDIQHSQHSKRVALRVVERLKTQKMRKNWENIKFELTQSLVPSLPSRNKTFLIAVKNYAEAVVKVFCSCQFCMISVLCSKYFVHNCSFAFIAKYYRNDKSKSEIFLVHKFLVLFVTSLKTYIKTFIEANNFEVSSFHFFTLLATVIFFTYFIHHLIISFYECLKSRVNTRTRKLKDINHLPRKKTFKSFCFISGIQ